MLSTIFRLSIVVTPSLMLSTIFPLPIVVMLSLMFSTIFPLSIVVMPSLMLSTILMPVLLLLINCHWCYQRFWCPCCCCCFWCLPSSQNSSHRGGVHSKTSLNVPLVGLSFCSFLARPDSIFTSFFRSLSSTFVSKISLKKQQHQRQRRLNHFQCQISLFSERRPKIWNFDRGWPWDLKSDPRN